MDPSTGSVCRSRRGFCDRHSSWDEEQEAVAETHVVHPYADVFLRLVDSSSDSSVNGREVHRQGDAFRVVLLGVIPGKTWIRAVALADKLKLPLYAFAGVFALVGTELRGAERLGDDVTDFAISGGDDGRAAAQGHAAEFTLAVF